MKLNHRGLLNFRNFICGMLLLSSSILVAQEVYRWEDTIRNISEEIMMSDQWTARAASLEKMPSLLAKALDSEGSFNFTFDSSRIAITYAPDSTFRFLTGQAVLAGDAIEYYGVLQLRDDERNPVFLQDQSFSPMDIVDEVLTPESWNGALYYNMIKIQMEDKDYYVAFGFAAKTFFENSKVAEIIHFEKGQIRFGAPLFIDGNEKKRHRLSLVYAADVGARLNYDTALAMIVFDNLIPMKSPYKERQVMMVPDGSYSGYTWEENKGWVFVEKIFHETLEEPPREVPVLDSQKGKDITGKVIKEKNR